MAQPVVNGGLAALAQTMASAITTRSGVTRACVWHQAYDPEALLLIADAGARAADCRAAVVALPLTFDGRPLGVLTVAARHLTDDERAWLSIVADCIAASMASAEALEAAQSVIAGLERTNADLDAELRDAFDEAPIPYVHEGLDTRFIRANRAALDLLGIGPDDVPTTYGRTFVADTPENQLRLKEALEGVSRGKETRHAVLELRRKDDGRPVWVQWWSQPAPSGAHTRTMMVDITNHVLAERTRDALQLSMESGQVGDWDLDLVHDTSRRSLRHDQCFGYDSPIPENEWGAARFLTHVHEADRDRVQQSMQRAVADQHDWSCEFRVLWANGSLHWLVARGRVYQTKDGKAERMLGVVMDITERMRIEEALRDTKAALDFALESAGIGDWDLDVIHDTSRRSMRHDRCFGYVQPIPETEWGVAQFSKHLHSEDRERVLSSMSAAVAEGNDWATEFRVVWADRSVHWLDARGRVYRTRDGVPERMLGVVMDITDRKDAERALSASEQLARGQVDALTRTLDAPAIESAPDRVIEHVLRTITEQLGAHSTSMWRRDDSSGLCFFECASENGRFVTKADVTLTGVDIWLSLETFEPFQRVFASRRPEVMHDIRTMSFPFQPRLVALGVVTVLIVPMFLAGKVEGILGIRFREKRWFTGRDLVVMQALVNQATLAAELRRLSSQSLTAAVADERNRMARDVHDTLAQGFTGVIVQLEAAADATSKGLTSEADAHVKRAGRLARDSLQEARRSVRALRPQELENETLAAAMAALFRKMTEGTEVRSQFVVSGSPRDLPPEWDVHLLRIGQEVATNMLRHACAHRFDVEMTFAQKELRLQLRDDGRGFDLAVAHDGLGLVGLRERVERMGGTVAIESADGHGATVSIALPLPAEFQEAAS